MKYQNKDNHGVIDLNLIKSIKYQYSFNFSYKLFSQNFLNKSRDFTSTNNCLGSDQ